LNPALLTASNAAPRGIDQNKDLFTGRTEVHTTLLIAGRTLETTAAP